MIAVDVSEVEAVAALLRGGVVDDVVADEADAAVTDAAAIALRGVRAAARRHRRTGHLEAGTTAKVTGSGTATTAVVGTTAIGALIVHGARPHDIRPLHAHALAFGGGAQHFAAGVHHPGAAPDPFIARGMTMADAELDALTDDTAHDLAVHVAARLEG